ncbi:PH domain-containing protein [Alkalihalophilus pseudofirmus]|uniref:PH domain-containing protein n=1 Tax=Alkalihalophilus pseudofirmus TaxID=79885 RepID=UPI00259AF726|nr:PH domain-containing protein [Alkalihalophilus pseudofirmus]WEG18411.1 PH domain-containing protein [Alkalihalophilus pseudofirmus]
MRAAPSTFLPEKARSVWRLQAFFESLLVALFPIAYGVLIYFFDFPLWILFSLIGFYLIFVLITVFILPPIRWRRFTYDVLEGEVDIQFGVLIVRRQLIPMTRVQHVDTEQGPLLRRYKMADVTITTAATSHRIPTLSVEVADELRDRIARLAAVAYDE